MFVLSTYECLVCVSVHVSGVLWHVTGRGKRRRSSEDGEDKREAKRPKLENGEVGTTVVCAENAGKTTEQRGGMTDLSSENTAIAMFW